MRAPFHASLGSGLPPHDAPVHIKASGLSGEGDVCRASGGRSPNPSKLAKTATFSPAVDKVLCRGSGSKVEPNGVGALCA